MFFLCTCVSVSMCTPNSTTPYNQFQLQHQPQYPHLKPTTPMPLQYVMACHVISCHVTSTNTDTLHTTTQHLVVRDVCEGFLSCVWKSLFLFYCLCLKVCVFVCFCGGECFVTNIHPNTYPHIPSPTPTPTPLPEHKHHTHSNRHTSIDTHCQQPTCQHTKPHQQHTPVQPCTPTTHNLAGHVVSGRPVSNARKFQAITSLWFHNKSNTTNMITFTLACP